jgi:hypothetical protein
LRLREFIPCFTDNAASIKIIAAPIPVSQPPPPPPFWPKRSPPASTSFEVTFIDTLPLTLPVETELAVITADPSDGALTYPELSTVATELSELDQSRDLSEAF